MKFQDLFKEGMTVEEFNEVVEKVVQSETDRVRTEYSTKIKEIETKIPQDKTEEEIALEQRIKAVEEKEKQYKLIDILEQKKLPRELSKYLSVNEEQFDTFGDELASVLGNLTKDNTFTPSNHRKTETVVTKDKFKTMSYMEREKFSNDHPELYQEYTK